MNGTTALINGKVAHSKVRGRAFVKALHEEYNNEEANAGAMESSKKPTNHGKKK